MPNQVLKSLVKNAPDKDATLEKAEQYWDEAKKQAKKAGLEEDSDNFYAYVMSIVKRRLGYKDKEESSIITAKDRLKMYYQSNSSRGMDENVVEWVDKIDKDFKFDIYLKGSEGSVMWKRSYPRILKKTQKLSSGDTEMETILQFSAEKFMNNVYSFTLTFGLAPSEEHKPFVDSLLHFMQVSLSNKHKTDREYNKQKIDEAMREMYKIIKSADKELKRL